MQKEPNVAMQKKAEDLSFEVLSKTPFFSLLPEEHRITVKTFYNLFFDNLVRGYMEFVDEDFSSLEAVKALIFESKEFSKKLLRLLVDRCPPASKKILFFNKLENLSNMCHYFKSLQNPETLHIFGEKYFAVVSEEPAKNRILVTYCVLY